mgnify:CR=1 FL=1
MKKKYKVSGSTLFYEVHNVMFSPFRNLRPITIQDISRLDLVRLYPGGDPIFSFLLVFNIAEQIKLDEI